VAVAVIVRLDVRHAMDYLQVARSNFTLVGWLFNGTSTQKGQFVPTAGEGNWLSRLRMANEIKCILHYVTR